jgi:hypothetical protein
VRDLQDDVICIGGIAGLDGPKRVTSSANYATQGQLLVADFEDALHPIDFTDLFH